MGVYAEMVGTSPAMQAVFDRLRKIAQTDLPVLITGETGTGKELTAQAIHARSHRQAGPFVAINCSAIPETLMESELFGHERGTFTGAVQEKKGRVEAAAEGTLFLDEVGELPLALQVKLLRFLQEGIFERVGGRRTLKIDTRVIAATNVALQAAIAQNQFREDLYYRLGVMDLHLPPLRDRGEDVVLMALCFLKRVAADDPKGVRGYTPAALRAIRAYGWPGNVRELSNKVRRAVVLAEGPEVTPQDLDLPEAGLEFEHSLDSLRAAHRRIEVELLVKALSLHRGNLTRVARDLEVSRSTLYRKLRTYNLHHLISSHSLSPAS